MPSGHILAAVMRRLLAIVTALIGAAAARLALRHADDARNVSRLRARYDLGVEDATALYRLARKEGFGHAAQRLLGDRRRPDGDDHRPVS